MVHVAVQVSYRLVGDNTHVLCLAKFSWNQFEHIEVVGVLVHLRLQHHEIQLLRAVVHLVHMVRYCNSGKCFAQSLHKLVP